MFVEAYIIKTFNLLLKIRFNFWGTVYDFVERGTGEMELIALKFKFAIFKISKSRIL